MGHYAFHYVYTLANPITKEIFYVGCTAYVSIRKRQHAKKFSSHFNGQEPLFQIVDKCYGKGFSSWMGLENDWINKMISEGHNLINKRYYKEAS